MNDLVKSASPADITQPNELPDRINAAHEQVKQALQRGAEHAIEAGRLLLQAKATVRHGDWLEWIGTNCKFAERTAQLYMRLAEERPLSRFLLRVLLDEESRGSSGLFKSSSI